MKVVDPDTGLVVPRGTPGELCTRGYSVMLGYWDDEAATAAAIDESRWMHTGDLATMDDDGYLNIVGRIKDIVIRGGENISPARGRGVPLHASGDPRRAGVRRARRALRRGAGRVGGRRREGATLDAADVRAFCEGQIARFKIPRYVRFVDAFPLTVTGKVQKFKMREHEIEALGLESAAGAKTA